MGSADSSVRAARTLAVAQSFGRRAGDYARHAHLQRHAAQALAGFLAEHGDLPEGLVAEIGCGTGLLTELLHQPGRPYLATDLAPEMLEQCRLRLGERPGLSFAVLDGQTPSFAAAPAALVSNLACQWFAEPVAGILRLAQASPMFAFSVPLAGSFPEWEAAFAAEGLASGLLPLPSEAEILAALAGLPGIRTAHRVEKRTQRFPSAQAFADSFRRIGADQPRSGYVPRPIRAVLKRFETGLDATARILYCLARRRA